MKLLKGDNIKLLKELEDNSIDSIVTDPPYALVSVKKRFGKKQSKGFMGKEWDAEVPSVEFWSEVYRVLKPGGHILSFGGTRTYHRMVVNIEDAGFDIRDTLSWLYGSGFPKSHNIGKGVDKKIGNEREIVKENKNHRKTSGLLELGFQDGKEKSYITKGESEWEGFGTALKPAVELIVLARKPLSEKTIVDNVLKWRTGGLNIDGCRVEIKEGGGNGSPDYETHNLGRFPSNLLLDEEAAEMLDDKSRYFYQAKVSKKERNMGLEPVEVFSGRPRREDGSVIYKETHLEEWKEAINKLPRKDKTPLGSSEEKLQIQKTSTKNIHPTTKPVNLMNYLCRLITPPGGVVLDPFMGSGSTGISALLEGFDFIGMELEEEYFEIAEQRIKNYKLFKEFIK